MHQIEKSISECIARAEFVSADPDTTVSDAAAQMIEQGKDCVLIVEGGHVRGIFTERDFLSRISVPKLDPSKTQLREVMTENPESLGPFDCVTYAINRMALGGYRNIPIVDDDGRPTSVLDVRLVMLHLIKVFAELEGEKSEADGEWIDLGGG